MNWNSEDRTKDKDLESLDPAMKQALSDFKASVHAWGEAEFHRVRTQRATVVRRTWRLAAGWAMACVVLAGSVSGGVYEIHKRHVDAVAAAQREAEQQKVLAAQKARQQAQQDEEMLASVDKAVSREVPSAMEPLAVLGESDSEQQ